MDYISKSHRDSFLHNYSIPSSSRHEKWQDFFGYFNALETHSDTTLPFRDVAKLAFIHNSVIAVVVTRVMLNMEKFAADFVYSNETVMKQGTVFILEQLALSGAFNLQPLF